MELTHWLVDKSAIPRLPESTQAKLWVERINNNQLHITTMTRLEIGYSARSSQDLENAFSSLPLSRMSIEGVTPAIEERAWQVLKLLAKKGHHRAPSIPDLIIAATAEIANYVVLHNDKDFDLIAKVTGQKVEKIKY